MLRLKLSLPPPELLPEPLVRFQVLSSAESAVPHCEEFSFQLELLSLAVPLDCERLPPRPAVMGQ